MTVLYVNTPEGADLLARHKAAWTAVAAADDLNIDAGVLADVSRVLRLPGSTNFNNSNPVRVVSSDGPRYTIQELTDLYAPVSVKVPRQTVKRDRATSPSTPSPLVKVSQSDRPGDRFSFAWPASEFAVELFDAIIERGTGLVFPDVTGEYAGYDTARIYWADAATPEKFTFQSTTAQAVFGLEGPNHSWTSFDLLVHSITGPEHFEEPGDPRSAAAYRDTARLVRRAECNGTWGVEFIDSLRNKIQPSIAEAFGVFQDVESVVVPVVPVSAPVIIMDPQAAVQTHAPRMEVVAPSDDEQEAADNAVLAAIPGLGTFTGTVGEGEEGPTGIVALAPITVSQAIEGGTPARFELDGGLAAVLYGGDGQHGFYQRVWANLNGRRVEVEPRRLTSWVAFKSVEVAQMSVDSKGREVREGDPKVTLTIAGAPAPGANRGIVRSQEGFTVTQAHDPKFVLNALNVGVALPIGTAERNHVTNGLMTLGANGTGTEKQSEFGTLGWMIDSGTGKSVYLAPAASMTADGPSKRWTVGAPPGSDAGALGETQLSYGWPTVPESTEAMIKAGCSIPAFLATTPGNNAAFAMLGALFMSPLTLPRRLTLFLAADPDSGKTLLAGAAQAFLTGLGGTAGFTGGDFGQPSAKGAPVAARWARHGCTIWDDYRLVDVDADRVAITKAATTAITQAAYGGSSSGAKSTRTGGLGRTVTADVTAIITGEGLPASTAVLSRVLAVQVAYGDIAIFPQGESALDQFVSGHSEGAREIYGAYIQWLAKRLDKAGSLGAFRAENVRMRREVTPTNGRSAELAGGLAVGWAMFKAFALEAGFNHLLPKMPEVKGRVAELADSTASLVKEANPAKSIINAARDALAAGAGHFDLHDNSTPSAAMARRLGWKWKPSIGSQLHRTGVWDVSYKSLGTLSADGEWVVLKKQAVEDLKKQIGLSAPASQLESAFKPLVSPETMAKPGGQSPASLGLRRIRGFVLPASMFDLGSENDAVEDAAF